MHERINHTAHPQGQCPMACLAQCSEKRAPEQNLLEHGDHECRHSSTEKFLTDVVVTHSEKACAGRQCCNCHHRKRDKSQGETKSKSLPILRGFYNAQVAPGLHVKIPKQRPQTDQCKAQQRAIDKPVEWNVGQVWKAVSEQLSQPVKPWRH